MADWARAGSCPALEDLTSRILPKVYALALRMLWNVEDAHDATQEILIRIITNLSTFREECAFLTWAYRVAANYLLTFRKTRLLYGIPYPRTYVISASGKIVAKYFEEDYKERMPGFEILRGMEFLTRSTKRGI